MEKKKNIEKAVCEYFKVKPKDLYSLSKRKYPQGIARDILMYLLFANGYKSYTIAEMFGFDPLWSTGTAVGCNQHSKLNPRSKRTWRRLKKS